MVAPSNDKLNELKMVETSTADSQHTFNSWLTLNANDNILELVCCAGSRSILVLSSPMVSCTALSELALSTYSPTCVGTRLAIQTLNCWTGSVIATTYCFS